MPSLLPYLLLLFAASALIGKTIYSHYVAAKLARGTWQDLVLKLQHLNLDGVTTVARDFLEPRPSQIQLEPGQMWELVGGYRGLRKMRANAEVMLALASYTKRWNFDESVIVSERMRRDATALHRAIRRVELRRIGELKNIYRLLPHHFHMMTPFDVHQAASSYYLMRQRLLALYETSHAGLYPALSAKL